MKRLTILVITALIPLLANSQSALKQDTLKIYPVKELKEDFVFFREVMETIHPSLYRYNTKDSVDKWFNNGLAQINKPLNDIAFDGIIETILARLGSGHTDIQTRKEVAFAASFGDPYLLPFNIYIRDNRLFVKNTVSPIDTNFKTGDEILVINNQTASSILAEARSHVTGDGYSNNFKDFKIEGSFGGVYRLSHPNSTQFLVIFKSGDTVKRRLVKAANLMGKNISGNYFSDFNQQRDRYGPQHKVSYPYDIPETAILKIRDFTYEKDYRSYHKKLFEEFKNGGIQNLVIDLRNNTGGNINIAIDLMKYLAIKNFHISQLDEWYVTFDRFNQLNKLATASYKPLNLALIDHNLTREKFGINWVQAPYTTNNFKGHIYILINNGTFSAAALFATAMKAQVPCTIIGQETGGGIAGCDGGEIADVLLPNTRSVLRMPLLYIYSVNKEHDYGQGLRPDIEFYPSPQDIQDDLHKKIDPIFKLLKANIISGK